jgi:Stress responsive A/B Barrel Domain
MLPVSGSVLVLAAVVAFAASVASAAEPKVLAHDVFFTLNDSSPAAKARLVAACQKYLTGHEGVVSFAVGTLADELDRPVNDREYDVALHVYFADAAAHTRYQDHPRHKQFIEENNTNWKKVRVFDSWVERGK